jgi:hypothetical protein
MSWEISFSRYIQNPKIASCKLRKRLYRSIFDPGRSRPIKGVMGLKYLVTPERYKKRTDAHTTTQPPLTEKPIWRHLGPMEMDLEQQATCSPHFKELINSRTV